VNLGVGPGVVPGVECFFDPTADDPVEPDEAAAFALEDEVWGVVHVLPGGDRSRMRKPGRLHLKSEVHYVAVAKAVILAFQAPLAGVLGALFAATGEVVVVADDLCVDEAALDRCGSGRPRLGRRGADARRDKEHYSRRAALMARELRVFRNTRGASEPAGEDLAARSMAARTRSWCGERSQTGSAFSASPVNR
jgi:hypothetical protein